MSTEIFSSISQEELQTVLDNKLFRSMLDTMHNGVLVLKASRNKKDEITDFKYVYANASAKNFEGEEIIGKKLSFHSANVNKHPLFEKLVNVVNTGATKDFVHPDVCDEKNLWFHYSIQKFGDGAMITYEDITAQKVAEEQLKQSEAFKTMIANTVPSIIYITDLERLNITYINAKVEEIFGTTANAIYDGEHDIFLNLAHPVDYSKRMAQLTQLQNTNDGLINEIEVRLKVKDGSYRWFSILDRVFERNEKSEPVKSIGIAHDIHEAKLSFLKSEQEKHRLKEAEEIGQVGSFEWDAEIDFIYWSDEMFRIHGLQPQSEVITLERVLSFIHPDDVIDTKEKMISCRKEARAVDIVHRILREDGTIRIVNRKIKSFTNEAGTVTHLRGTVQDITEQKKAEEELLKQHKILKQAEELEEAGSWEYNVNTKEFIWSDGMYELFEMKKNTLVTPKIYLDKALEEDEWIARKVITLIEQRHSPFEETLRIKTGKRIKDVKIKATIVNDGKGKALKVLGVNMDITFVKEAQERIKELNYILLSKNRELQSINSELRTFASVAAGDYKETLKHLYTLFEFVVTNDASNLSNTGKANIRRAQSAIQKMKLLTDDIVAYSEIQNEASGIKTVNLPGILNLVFQKLERKIEDTNAEIIQHVQVGKIEGSPDLLSLLFYHLIDNAIKFRKQDVRPVIEVQFSIASGMQINHAFADPEINYYLISVIDNGIGVDPSVKEKIFEMFYKAHDKTKYRGSGIGLAICKKIMNIHNGFITVDSTPENKGTSFNCYFPFPKKHLLSEG